MIFCMKRLHDFLCEEVFLVKKRFPGENSFFGEKKHTFFGEKSYLLKKKYFLQKKYL